MDWKRMVTVVGAHAEGEVGRVITGGVPDIPGQTMLEKLAYLRAHDDLRQFVNQEPRGCAQMTTNLLIQPCNPAADAAFIPMQADGCHAMSGSNAMCVTTVLLETGILPVTEPQTIVTLDTAAGLIKAAATCRDGKVERVALNFFPAYADRLDVPLDVEGQGTLAVDIAYGGVFYILVDVAQLGLRITPDVARDMVDLGAKIKAAAKAQLTVQHPEIPSFNTVDFVMFTDVVEDQPRCLRNATIMPPGRVDRSPCGTGSAARLATMHERGLVDIGDQLDMRSTIGSSFAAEIVGVTRIGDQSAILPRLSGRAWIYSLMQLGLDRRDPFETGYTLADTWGEEIDHALPNDLSESN